MQFFAPQAAQKTLEEVDAQLKELDGQIDGLISKQKPIGETQVSCCLTSRFPPSHRCPCSSVCCPSPPLFSVHCRWFFLVTSDPFPDAFHQTRMLLYRQQHCFQEVKEEKERKKQESDKLWDEVQQVKNEIDQLRKEKQKTRESFKNEEGKNSNIFDELRCLVAWCEGRRLVADVCGAILSSSIHLDPLRPLFGGLPRGSLAKGGARGRLGDIGLVCHAPVFDLAPVVSRHKTSLVMRAQGGVLVRRARAGHLFLTVPHPCLFSPPPHQTIWRTLSPWLRIWPILCTQFMTMARVVIGSGGSAILCC